MKKSLFQRILQAVRSRTPLSIRQKIGPIISAIIYHYKKTFRPNAPKPHVLSIPDTIDRIIEGKLSVIRFGDGEITLIDGGDLAFQKAVPALSEQLATIARTNDPKLLICVPGIWENLERFAPHAYKFNMHHLYRQGHIWKKILSHTQIYGDTNMTRPYLAYNDKSSAGMIFKKLFSIWDNADVVLIEGSKSRLGLGNDMFSNTKSLGRILCPPENAYSKYQEIKDEALKIPKDKLIVLSLGPTAKLLAYDLFKLGYRVIDAGHIDMEYEMFLRKEPLLTKVPYKYFNEINERDPEECLDPTYLSQIISKIV